MIRFLLLTLTLVVSFVNLLPVNYNDLNQEEYDHNLDDPNLFEGDITGVEFSEDTSKGLAQLITGTRTLWPFGIVPYKPIDTRLYNQTQVNTIIEGMRLLEDSVKINGRYCIQFVPWTNQANWIRFYNGTGCSSNVGKNTSPGEQLVSLKKPTPGSTSTCLRTGIIAHELLHAIGFWHEQSRPDRDNFVTVYYQNINTGNEHNFNKYTTNIDLLGLPYDYGSIMHYANNSFSSNGQPTMLPKVQGVTIGQRLQLSAQDIQEVRKYYNCV